MFREMRRARQALSEAGALDILDRGEYGTLALLGDGDRPYAVPLNYVLVDRTVYFHCAREGHKIDAIRRHPAASFCVVDLHQVRPAEYTTVYRSAIVFGTARMVEEDEEKRRAIWALTEKYCPGCMDGAPAAIEKEWERLGILALSIEHVTGKQAIELVRARNGPESGI